MEYENSTSSQVRRFGYDEKQQHLHIHFVSGGHYRYDGVSQDTFDEFRASDSHGRALNAIKQSHPFTRIS